MELAYLELKLAWSLFQKAPEALAEPEREQLKGVARRQEGIEQAILAHPDSADVIIPEATLKARLQEIRQRYPNETEYREDLARLGLDVGELAAAVSRDLRVEAVLERVAANVPATTEVDAEIYYRLHPEAFDRPPSRRLRHILITWNNAREKGKAQQQLEQLRQTLSSAEAFGQAALRYSQCPTAMEGGKLGLVKPGNLYAELEPAAFALSEGEISQVLASPIGLHILRCDEILPSGMLPFTEVCARIIDRLSEKRRSQAQRDWVKKILARQAPLGTMPDK